MRVNERLVESGLPEPYILHRYEEKDGTEWSSICDGEIEVMACRRYQEQQMFIEFYDYYKLLQNQKV